MPANKNSKDAEKRAKLHAELVRERRARETSYRGRALAMFPHLCASCGREFEGPRLRELTVHHKDHDHNNNPPDGSNWELLCLYCHDNEHERFRMKGSGGGNASADPPSAPIANPFEDLEVRLRPEDPDGQFSR